MEDKQTFQAPGDVVAEIDANMRRIHWEPVQQENIIPSRLYPPTTVPGPADPYARQYDSSSEPNTPVAWLFTPQEAGGSDWELDLEAFPAEVPAADC